MSLSTNNATLAPIYATPQMIELRPRMYLCGFPKSGLHMIEQAASVFVSPLADNNWFGTFGGNAWTTRWVHTERMGRVLDDIRPGTYLKGHTGYLPSIGDLFWGKGIAVVFVYRDLRDVVVSQAYHILNTDRENFKHPDKARFQAMDFEEVLIACIEGNGEYAGIFDRWELYAGWLDDGRALCARFEDWKTDLKSACIELYMFGLRMGLGNTDYEMASMPRDTFNNAVFEMIARVKDTSRSMTFRKGKSGGWKQYFTPRVKDIFKQLDPGWLVKLGYEQNEDW